MQFQSESGFTFLQKEGWRADILVGPGSTPGRADRNVGAPTMNWNAPPKDRGGKMAERRLPHAKTRVERVGDPAAHTMSLGGRGPASYRSQKLK